MRRKQPSWVAPVVAATMIVAVAVAGYLLVVSPQRSKAASLEKQIADARLQIRTRRPPDAARPEPVPVADLFRVAKAIPSESDMPGVILELNRLAAETGITFTSITPQPPIPLSGYLALPLAVVFEGNFYDLSDFLYRIRNLVGVRHGSLRASGRLFAVDSIDFTEGQRTLPEINAALTIDAFVYGTAGDDSTPTAAAQTAQPAGNSQPASPRPAAPPSSATASGVTP